MANFIFRGFNNIMKILQTNNYNYQSANFKSTFPVVHWVGEANGSYAPIAIKSTVEDFQARILDFLGKPLKKTYTEIQKLEKEKDKKNISDQDKKNIARKLKSLYEILDVPAQKLRAYMASCDVDYRLKPKARSYYNSVNGSIDTFTPTSYLITGKNILDFEERFAKKYGKENSRRVALIKQGVPPEKAETPEYKAAQYKYNNQGMDYVNYYPRRIKDKKGRTQTLHTKFQIERDLEGKFIGYRFIDARFLPEFGPESPFEKLKAYSNK
jgi:hypothetical protein